MYRADWTWQRCEEAILAMRYYWWCAQCATFVVLPMVRAQYGWHAVVWCLRHAASPAYVYDERHSWHSIRWEFEEPVDPWPIIAELREEAKWREKEKFLRSFAAPAQPDRVMPLTPLMHNDPNPWPSVQGRATVIYSDEIIPATPRDDSYWFGPEAFKPDADEPETVLLFPQVWPAAIEQGVST